ncbi:MAG: hypothetical protein ACRDJW_13385 [Thermomicrobiales bacterium]
MLGGVRDTREWRSDDRLAATEGASDKELSHLAGPMARLEVEDVRWDVIGAAHGGHRRRI